MREVATFVNECYSPHHLPYSLSLSTEATTRASSSSRGGRRHSGMGSLPVGILHCGINSGDHSFLLARLTHLLTNNSDHDITVSPSTSSSTNPLINGTNKVDSKGYDGDDYDKGNDDSQSKVEASEPSIVGNDTKRSPLDAPPPPPPSSSSSSSAKGKRGRGRPSNAQRAAERTLLVQKYEAKRAQAAAVAAALDHDGNDVTPPMKNEVLLSDYGNDINDIDASDSKPLSRRLRVRAPIQHNHISASSLALPTSNQYWQASRSAMQSVPLQTGPSSLSSSSSLTTTSSSLMENTNNGPYVAMMSPSNCPRLEVTLKRLAVQLMQQYPKYRGRVDRHGRAYRYTTADYLKLQSLEEKKLKHPISAISSWWADQCHTHQANHTNTTMRTRNIVLLLDDIETFDKR
jgi:hypothetical protein